MKPSPTAPDPPDPTLNEAATDLCQLMLDLKKIGDRFADALDNKKHPDYRIIANLADLVDFPDRFMTILDALSRAVRAMHELDQIQHGLHPRYMRKDH